MPDATKKSSRQREYVITKSAKSQDGFFGGFGKRLTSWEIPHRY